MQVAPFFVLLWTVFFFGYAMRTKTNQNFVFGLDLLTIFFFINFSCEKHSLVLYYYTS